MTEQQRDNLRKLANYLMDLPAERADQFDMQCFASRLDGEGVFPHALPLSEPPPCGTVCCAAGHGPAAGIATKHAKSTWSEYIHDAFGVQWESAECKWCFSGGWYVFDNTHHGAAKRILWMLDKGVPDNWCEQMIGKNPLCY